jgi:hypothetical protein
MRVIVLHSSLVSALVLGGLVTTVHAGAITTVSVVQLPGNVSTGSIGPLNNTSAPNNDEAPGANPNVVPYNLFINAPGVMDVEFVIGATGGVTEYRFAQGFLNNSRGPWSGWRFELGFGTGSGFVRSGAADGLDFDTPSSGAPSSPQFALSRHESDVMEWTGNVPWFGRGEFAFAIDVPDGLGAFNPSGFDRFTLRQIQNPAPESDVPEPSLLVLALAGVAAGSRRLRARR